MKTQQHLTPSQVEELRELGIEFEDTTCYWALFDNADSEYLRPYEVVLQDYLNSNESLLLYTDKGNGDYDIPAPDLQDLLEELPTTIGADPFDVGYEDCFELTLRRDHVSDLWHCDYLDNFGHSLFREEVSVLFGENPLLLAFVLLKLVATHHPESLTKID